MTKKDVTTIYWIDAYDDDFPEQIEEVFIIYKGKIKIAKLIGEKFCTGVEELHWESVSKWARIPKIKGQ